MTVTDNPGGYHGSCATGGPRGTLHISTMIPCYHMIITGCFLGVSSYSVGGNNILTNFILQLYHLNYCLYEVSTQSPVQTFDTSQQHSINVSMAVTVAIMNHNSSQKWIKSSVEFMHLKNAFDYLWSQNFIPLRNVLYLNLTSGILFELCCSLPCKFNVIYLSFVWRLSAFKTCENRTQSSNP